MASNLAPLTSNAGGQSNEKIEKYNGQTRYDMRDGWGMCRYSNSDEYIGEWRIGLRWGWGIYKVPEKMEWYEGAWNEGLMDGWGTYYYGNGDRYEGYWSHGFKHGWGLYEVANGDRYDGQWVLGKQSGKGTYYHQNGDQYSGEWFEDQRSGQGVYTFAGEGTVYDGGWFEGQRDGDGCFVGESAIESGTQFGGQWAKGLPHGFGVCRYTGLGIYRGYFQSGNRHGEGSFHYVNGRSYEGGWANGKEHGWGVLTVENGDAYHGSWKKGVRRGLGVYALSNGMMYQGEWANNLRHGVGLAIGVKLVMAGQGKKKPAEEEEKESGSDSDTDSVTHSELSYRTSETFDTSSMSEPNKVYIGEWRQGEMHGVGALVDTTTELKWQGIFEHGEFQRVVNWDVVTGDPEMDKEKELLKRKFERLAACFVNFRVEMHDYGVVFYSNENRVRTLTGENPHELFRRVSEKMYPDDRRDGTALTAGHLKAWMDSDSLDAHQALKRRHVIGGENHNGFHWAASVNFKRDKDDVILALFCVSVGFVMNRRRKLQPKAIQDLAKQKADLDDAEEVESEEESDYEIDLLDGELDILFPPALETEDVTTSQMMPFHQPLETAIIDSLPPPAPEEDELMEDGDAATGPLVIDPTAEGDVPMVEVDGELTPEGGLPVTPFAQSPHHLSTLRSDAVAAPRSEGSSAAKAILAHRSKQHPSKSFLPMIMSWAKDQVTSRSPGGVATPDLEWTLHSESAMSFASGTDTFGAHSFLSPVSSTHPSRAPSSQSFGLTRDSSPMSGFTTDSSPGDRAASKKRKKKKKKNKKDMLQRNHVHSDSTPDSADDKTKSSDPSGSTQNSRLKKESEALKRQRERRQQREKERLAAKERGEDSPYEYESDGSPQELEIKKSSAKAKLKKVAQALLVPTKSSEPKLAQETKRQRRLREAKERGDLPPEPAEDDDDDDASSSSAWSSESLSLDESTRRAKRVERLKRKEKARLGEIVEILESATGDESGSPKSRRKSKAGPEFGSDQHTDSEDHDHVLLVPGQDTRSRRPSRRPSRAPSRQAYSSSTDGSSEYHESRRRRRSRRSRGVDEDGRKDSGHSSRKHSRRRRHRDDDVDGSVSDGGEGDGGGGEKGSRRRSRRHGRRYYYSDEDGDDDVDGEGEEGAAGGEGRKGSRRRRHGRRYYYSDEDDDDDVDGEGEEGAAGGEGRKGSRRRRHGRRYYYSDEDGDDDVDGEGEEGAAGGEGRKGSRRRRHGRRYYYSDEDGDDDVDGEGEEGAAGAVEGAAVRKRKGFRKFRRRRYSSGEDDILEGEDGGKGSKRRGRRRYYYSDDEGGSGEGEVEGEVGSGEGDKASKRRSRRRRYYYSGDDGSEGQEDGEGGSGDGEGGKRSKSKRHSRRRRRYYYSDDRSEGDATGDGEGEGDDSTASKRRSRRRRRRHSYSDDDSEGQEGGESGDGDGDGREGSKSKRGRRHRRHYYSGADDDGGADVDDADGVGGEGGEKGSRRRSRRHRRRYYYSDEDGDDDVDDIADGGESRKGTRDGSRRRRRKYYPSTDDDVDGGEHRSRRSRRRRHRSRGRKTDSNETFSSSEDSRRATTRKSKEVSEGQVYFKNSNVKDWVSGRSTAAVKTFSGSAAVKALMKTKRQRDAAALQTRHGSTAASALLNEAIDDQNSDRPEAETGEFSAIANASSTDRGFLMPDFGVLDEVGDAKFDDMGQRLVKLKRQASKFTMETLKRREEREKRRMAKAERKAQHLKERKGGEDVDDGEDDGYVTSPVSDDTPSDIEKERRREKRKKRRELKEKLKQKQASGEPLTDMSDDGGVALDLSSITPTSSESESPPNDEEDLISKVRKERKQRKLLAMKRRSMVRRDSSPSDSASYSEDLETVVRRRQSKREEHEKRKQRRAERRREAEMTSPSESASLQEAPKVGFKRAANKKRLPSPSISESETESVRGDPSRGETKKKDRSHSKKTDGQSSSEGSSSSGVNSSSSSGSGNAADRRKRKMSLQVPRPPSQSESQTNSGSRFDAIQNAIMAGSENTAHVDSVFKDSEEKAQDKFREVQEPTIRDSRIEGDRSENSKEEQEVEELRFKVLDSIVKKTKVKPSVLNELAGKTKAWKQAKARMKAKMAMERQKLHDRFKHLKKQGSVSSSLGSKEQSLAPPPPLSPNSSRTVTPTDHPDGTISSTNLSTNISDIQRTLERQATQQEINDAVVESPKEKAVIAKAATGSRLFKLVDMSKKNKKKDSQPAGDTPDISLSDDNKSVSYSQSAWVSLTGKTGPPVVAEKEDDLWKYQNLQKSSQAWGTRDPEETQALFPTVYEKPIAKQPALGTGEVGFNKSFGRQPMPGSFGTRMRKQRHATLSGLDWKAKSIVVGGRSGGDRFEFRGLRGQIMAHLPHLVDMSAVPLDGDDLMALRHRNSRNASDLGAYFQAGIVKLTLGRKHATRNALRGRQSYRWDPPVVVDKKRPIDSFFQRILRKYSSSRLGSSGGETTDEDYDSDGSHAAPWKRTLRASRRKQPKSANAMIAIDADLARRSTDSILSFSSLRIRGSLGKFDPMRKRRKGEPLPRSFPNSPIPDAWEHSPLGFNESYNSRRLGPGDPMAMEALTLSPRPPPSSKPRVFKGRAAPRRVNLGHAPSDKAAQGTEVPKIIKPDQILRDEGVNFTYKTFTSKQVESKLERMVRLRKQKREQRLKQLKGGEHGPPHSHVRSEYKI